LAIHHFLAMPCQFVIDVQATQWFAFATMYCVGFGDAKAF